MSLWRQHAQLLLMKSTMSMRRRLLTSSSLSDEFEGFASLSVSEGWLNCTATNSAGWQGCVLARVDCELAGLAGYLLLLAPWKCWLSSFLIVLARLNLHFC